MKKILLLITVSLCAHLVSEAQEMKMISEIKQKTSLYDNWFMGSTDDALYFYQNDKNGTNGKVLVYNRSYQFEKEIVLSEDWASYSSARVIDEKTFCMMYSFKRSAGGETEYATRVHFYNFKGKKVEDREYDDASSGQFSFSRNNDYMAYRESDGDNVVVINTEDFKEVTKFTNYHHVGAINDDGSYMQLGFEQKPDPDADEDDEDDVEEIDDLSKPFMAFNKMGEEETRVSFTIDDPFPHHHDFWLFRDQGKMVITYSFGDEKTFDFYYTQYDFFTFKYYSTEGMGALIVDLETKKIEKTYRIEFSENDMYFKDRTENNNRFGGVEFLNFADIELVGEDIYIVTQSSSPIEFSEEIDEEETKAIHGIMIKFDDDGDHKQRLLESELNKGNAVNSQPGFKLFKTGDDSYQVAFVSDVSKKLAIKTYVLDDELELKDTKMQDFGGEFKYKISLYRALYITDSDNEYLAFGHKKKNKGFALFRLKL